MSELMMQYDASISRRQRLGMPFVAPARIPRDRIPSIRPVNALRKGYRGADAPVLIDPKPPRQVWPEQPPAVFYDEAARDTWAVTPKSIIADVCRENKVTLEELFGPRHFARYCLARQQATYRMTVELNMSLTAIGRRLNRDHTTILTQLASYTKTRPWAATQVRLVKVARMRRRKEMLAQAVEMFIGQGKSIIEVMEMLPLSRSSIQSAVQKHRLVNERLRVRADAGVSANVETTA